MSKVSVGFHIIDVEVLLGDLSRLCKLRNYTTAWIPFSTVNLVGAAVWVLEQASQIGDNFDNATDTKGIVGRNWTCNGRN